MAHALKVTRASLESVIKQIEYYTEKQDHPRAVHFATQLVSLLASVQRVSLLARVSAAHGASLDIPCGDARPCTVYGLD